MPESLAESEFFGHEKGAFTGADRSRQGRFEEAHGGTLLLDEIGDLSLPLQAKLLRVLEEHVIRRVGGSRDVAVDVRLVAATNRDLAEAVESGAFRRDLYFRLNVIHVMLPPLRERRGDVAPLAEHFVGSLAARHGIKLPEIEPEAAAALDAYDWPGNVRELRNVLERAVVVRGSDPIRARNLVFEASRPPLTRSPEPGRGRDAGPARCKRSPAVHDGRPGRTR